MFLGCVINVLKSQAPYRMLPLTRFLLAKLMHATLLISHNSFDVT